MNSTDNRVRDLNVFYSGKKVLNTGIHGFKGSWLAVLLRGFGANVVGVGVQQEEALLYPLLKLNQSGVSSYDFDITRKLVSDLIEYEEPDIIFHLAAQPIVSVSYEDPYNTYMTNVIGTLNILEGIRKLTDKVSIINVTTDKVYRNYEKADGYSENEELMGSDPYSSSKSCVELLNFAYNESYFKNQQEDSAKIISTVRAGNVIGGGDFATNRIIPDLIRGIKGSTPVSIRNFDSVRPYQHVLDAVFAYERPEVAGAYNIGPDTQSLMKTREIVDYAVKNYGAKIIDDSAGETFHETNILTLNSNKFRNTFDWSPIWASKENILENTFKWYSSWIDRYNVKQVTVAQIKEFLNV